MAKKDFVSDYVKGSSKGKGMDYSFDDWWQKKAFFTTIRYWTKGNIPERIIVPGLNIQPNELKKIRTKQTETFEEKKKILLNELTTNFQKRYDNFGRTKRLLDKEIENTEYKLDELQKYVDIIGREGEGKYDYMPSIMIPEYGISVEEYIPVVYAQVYLDYAKWLGDKDASFFSNTELDTKKDAKKELSLKQEDYALICALENKNITDYISNPTKHQLQHFNKYKENAYRTEIMPDWSQTKQKNKLRRYEKILPHLKSKDAQTKAAKEIAIIKKNIKDAQSEN